MGKNDRPPMMVAGVPRRPKGIGWPLLIGIGLLAYFLAYCWTDPNPRHDADFKAERPAPTASAPP